MLATEGTRRTPHAFAWLLVLDSSVPQGPPPSVSSRGSGVVISARGLPRHHHHPVPSRRVVELATRTHPSITATTASFISQRTRPLASSAPNTRLPATATVRYSALARNDRSGTGWIEVGLGRSRRGLWDRRRRSRHAAGEHGAAGGPAVGARDEPVADHGRGVVGEGAGDREAAGGDAGDAARPPRVRLRALAHRPRREDRGRGRGRRQRSRSRSCGARPEDDRGEGPGRRACAAAAEARAEGVGAAPGQREPRRGQLPQQQRRRPAQLLHAALAHPELHRAAPHPDAVVRLRPEPQRRIRLQQEGQGPGRRDRQVLVVAVGSAVAKVQPAGPGRAAQRERVCHPRRVGRHPQSGQALRPAGQYLSRFFSSAAGCVVAAGFQSQLFAVYDCLYICSACDVIYNIY